MIQEHAYITDCMQKDMWAQEARRLGYEKEIECLQEAASLQGPLLDKEKRACQRARSLVCGRGWPTEKIAIFFLEDDALRQISNENKANQLPSTLGPTAVLVPRSFSNDLNESEITRIVIHEMVHARSQALPAPPLPRNWQKDAELHQLQMGLAEIVAERIMPLPSPAKNQTLCSARLIAEKICQKACLDEDAIERISTEEAVYRLCNNLHWNLQELSAWIKQEAVSLDV